MGSFFCIGRRASACVGEDCGDNTVEWGPAKGDGFEGEGGALAGASSGDCKGDTLEGAVDANDGHLITTDSVIS